MQQTKIVIVQHNTANVTKSFIAVEAAPHRSYFVITTHVCSSGSKIVYTLIPKFISPVLVTARVSCHPSKSNRYEVVREPRPTV